MDEYDNYIDLLLEKGLSAKSDVIDQMVTDAAIGEQR